MRSASGLLNLCKGSISQPNAMVIPCPTCCHQHGRRPIDRSCSCFSPSIQQQLNEAAMATGSRISHGSHIVHGVGLHRPH